jgi:GNAT superfamily N-acetyltransferase
LLRLAIAPEFRDDEDLAEEIAGNLNDPQHALLPPDGASVELRLGESLRRRLLDDGWEPGEPWTPLRRDLASPVRDCGLRIEVVAPDGAGVRADVQRVAFDRSTFTEDRWHAMASGSPYADARCLVAYDDRSTAVAAATVWSAGAGRPGLLEPMGVHRDHRGRGYGTAITLSAAGALRELGASSALVCTAGSNLGAVATYASAGFERQPDVCDLRRKT